MLFENASLERDQLAASQNSCVTSSPQLPGLNRRSIYTILFIFLLNHNSHAQTEIQLSDSGQLFIKPPFRSCHAATIVETGKDRLLYAWFGGDYEGAENVCIWGCFRNTGKKEKPGKPFLLASAQDSAGHPVPCWNPVLFKTKQGTIILDYKAGKNPREWYALRKTSMDNGRTWSAAKPLPAGFLGPIKNKPVQLRNGDILYGSSMESMDMIHWTSHAEISNEAGSEWKYISIDCDTFAVIQPTILQHKGDTLQMLCRSKQNRILETWSADGGHHWTTIRSTALQNPNSGIDAVTLKNGYQILVCNPLPSGGDWWNGRNRLVVMGSADGRDWKELITLESAPEGEFSYPAVITDRKGMIRIAYTDNRKSIKFADLQLK